LILSFAYSISEEDESLPLDLMIKVLTFFIKD